MVKFKLKLLTTTNIIALNISEFLLRLSFIKTTEFLVSQVKKNSIFIEEVINNG